MAWTISWYIPQLTENLDDLVGINKVEPCNTFFHQFNAPSISKLANDFTRQGRDRTGQSAPFQPQNSDLGLRRTNYTCNDARLNTLLGWYWINTHVTGLPALSLPCTYPSPLKTSGTSTTWSTLNSCRHLRVSVIMDAASAGFRFLPRGALERVEGRKGKAYRARRNLMSMTFARGSVELISTPQSLLGYWRAIDGIFN